ncbi:uncharacterized protein EDB91DRAFT_1088180 [Suillus paluster]|uniref:uncharacterized protein n=1 Tax=Suillus paluster TaxID=48578 RepID=UPI001B8863CD|nr:uncharacterized protein EDB91DRAFT_1088180 [Suillus paluster]KAG1722325.1 hypothetical protein EDB91DRAFT_1088180 [Suillus paluster]
MAGRSAIHKTPEAKLQAVREKRKGTITDCRCRHKEMINTKRHLSCTVPTHKISSDSASQMEMDTSPTPPPTTLSDCLELVKDAKDKLIGLSVLSSPYAFVKQILGKYITMVPWETFNIESVESVHGKDMGDTSIIKDAISMVRNIHGVGSIPTLGLYPPLFRCIRHPSDVHPTPIHSIRYPSAFRTTCGYLRISPYSSHIRRIRPVHVHSTSLIAYGTV